MNIEWHERVLTRGTTRALKFLSTRDWLRRSQWYLAGGTALALQAGHRQSLDLDFFVQQKDFDLNRLLAHFSSTPLVVDVAKEGTLFGALFNTKVSFIAYPFFIPRAKPIWYGAVRILAAKDIATMKIVAISQRGRKRDFIDLYWYVMHHEPLVDILRRLPEQYPTVAHDYHFILKALMYFEDADQDPMPKIFFKATWREIKRYFQTEVPGLAKELLGIS